MNREAQRSTRVAKQNNVKHAKITSEQNECNKLQVYARLKLIKVKQTDKLYTRAYIRRRDVGLFLMTTRNEEKARIDELRATRRRRRCRCHLRRGREL